MDTYFRRSASPKAAADLLIMNTYTDVRELLPSLGVPTLVLQAVSDRDVQAAEGRYIASRIAGAQYVEFPSGDHFFWASHQEEILAEIQDFLTGVRPPPEHERILPTVLFTDIVEGTKKAAALGDRRWRDLLESHHAFVRTTRAIPRRGAGHQSYALGLVEMIVQLARYGAASRCPLSGDRTGASHIGVFYLQKAQ